MCLFLKVESFIIATFSFVRIFLFYVNRHYCLEGEDEGRFLCDTVSFYAACAFVDLVYPTNCGLP